jgi:carbamoyl-phosphate synthase small subunit
MTYPLIGNYGITDDDYESKAIKMSGFIVREYNDLPSNFRATKTLGDVMDENNAAGISNIDTRKLVRIIRDQGSMLAMITDIDKPTE